MAKSKRTIASTKMRAHVSSKNKLSVTFIQELPLKQLLMSAPILAIVMILFVMVAQSSLPPEVPLFYGLPEGEEQLVSSVSLIIPNLVSLAIFVINTTLVYFIKDKFVQSTLIVATLAITLLASITTVKIIVLINSFAL